MAEPGTLADRAVGQNLSGRSEASPARRIRPIWIASYPRSGNTFLRILLQNFFQLPTYSAYHVEGQGFEDPSATPLEQAPLLPRNWRELLSDAPDAPATLIKTHDRPAGDAPAIYVARDGRAAIDSYFHYHRKFAFEKPSLTEVIAGACQFGRWGEHYLAWHPATRPRTLLLRYEALVNRPQEVVSQLANFLNQKPAAGRVPTFEELKAKSPAFFRRGPNEDFLSQWSPAQMNLFNDLHGAVMEQLGYTLVRPGDGQANEAGELARRAAYWHDQYLEKLQSLGHTAATCEQLYKEKERLENELQRVSAVLGPLLESVWIKIGFGLGLIPRASKARRRLKRSRLQAKMSPAPAPGGRPN